jgi:hypothetical protein
VLICSVLGKAGKLGQRSASRTEFRELKAAMRRHTMRRHIRRCAGRFQESGLANIALDIFGLLVDL